MPDPIVLMGCHRLPERSFFWKGKQFPVCARCTGLYVGYLSLPVFTFGFASLAIWPSVLLVVPMLLDGITQLFTDRLSNNYLRLATGVAAGIGLMSLCAHLGNTIGLYLIHLLNT